MPKHKITSEVHSEIHTVTSPVSQNNTNKKIPETKLLFQYPPHLLKPEDKEIKYDKDGDIILNRNKKMGVILVEHRVSTELQNVGLQLWRGALLLADYILANPAIFQNKYILELGAGVGLTSIVASIVAKQVVCTDLDSYDIIESIKRNFKRNSQYVNAEFHIMGLNFFNTDWPPSLTNKLKNTLIILAADVIYDNDITEGFVNTLHKLFTLNEDQIAYVALEKRYVFTISDLDTVAPMYEEFNRFITNKKLKWNIEMINTDFPQYFQYNRVPQLILMKIQVEK